MGTPGEYVGQEEEPEQRRNRHRAKHGVGPSCASLAEVCAEQLQLLWAMRRRLKSRTSWRVTPILERTRIRRDVAALGTLTEIPVVLRTRRVEVYARSVDIPTRILEEVQTRLDVVAVPAARLRREEL